MSDISRRADGRRLYEHIAEALTAQITSGQYKVGSRLPSERDLAQTFSVSRPTIREAVIALELDGLVEVRLGSGVYVKQSTPQAGGGGPDVGPFELLEARRLIESEICAMAATRITPAQLDELEALVAEMEHENQHDVVMSEKADRRFHEAIADATENSQLRVMLDSLWDARARSPLIRRMSLKAHAAGVKPRISEHREILDALRAGDAQAARGAMHEHLSRVIDSLLEATEVEEIERARAQVAEKRRRYSQLSSTPAPATRSARKAGETSAG
jgi:DNA-binding FadR family transcriptional regulator